MLRTRTQRDSLLQACGVRWRACRPGRAIVFAGREGVERIASSLVESGLCDVRRLKDAHRDSSGRSRMGEEEEVDDEPDQLIQKDKPEELEDGVTPATAWSSTASTLAVSATGAGSISRSTMSSPSPPANSATYAHLAGRTGREWQARNRSHAPHTSAGTTLS